MQQRWEIYLKSHNRDTTQAKSLWCGNGADELFGGYGRHRTAELHGALDAWRKEMSLDLQRLWKRNLGRDDRCLLLTNRWKGTQYLFLSCPVVQLVSQLSNEILRYGFSEQFGSDTKVVLRELAWHWGLRLAPFFRKRAIQFGSRSAQKSTPEGTTRRKIKGTATL
eukprot:Blabericola_migrator_1__4446@NODE_2380_length_2853_cov_60_959440_g1490_i0_p2_GENE_NODE_2380_length_2853_cov_60_959440_g1490_i0NODE_2380_length_2853_cov_60_959440_g1490_i0_p2_ORF_typecomplete_len166_score33_67Asn_synthase/PF00733_21/4_4e12_NODE_2380_length_2853_cov_60_959440_g1490_i022202717